MRYFGLIGYPLVHSFSPGYFRKKFEALDVKDSVYDLYPLVHIEEFPELLRKIDFCGLNVTIPYKEKVIPFLDKLDEVARHVGAVNCISVSKGKTTGYNTDVYGFEVSLLEFLRGDLNKKALVLGRGGAAKAVHYVLKKLNIPYLEVSRQSGQGIGYDDIRAEILNEYTLIINTTPVGMYPDIDVCPDLPYTYLSATHFLYDLIYNPKKTLFLAKGFQQNCKIINGERMLQLQAEKSWEIWQHV